MVGYKIAKDECGYHFLLVEPQNHNQFYGRSVSFASEDECREKLREFISLLTDIKDQSENPSKYEISIEETDKGRIFKFYLDGKLAFFRDKPYSGGMRVVNCDKGINSMVRYSREFLKKRI